MHKWTTQFYKMKYLLIWRSMNYIPDILWPKSYFFDQMVALWRSSKIVIYTCSEWKNNQMRILRQIGQRMCKLEQLLHSWRWLNFAVLPQWRLLIKSYSFHCQSLQCLNYCLNWVWGVMAHPLGMQGCRMQNMTFPVANQWCYNRSWMLQVLCVQDGMTIILIRFGPD